MYPEENITRTNQNITDNNFIDSIQTPTPTLPTHPLRLKGKWEIG